ncbi:MAG TPA: hypothetical protein VMY39_04805, partial [Planctomycetota bacterium]|nr:hypothetical protein [Planctomycetota bacterium]
RVSWVNVYTRDGALKKAKLVRMGSINEIQMGRDGLYAVEASFSASTSMRLMAERNEGVPHWTLFNKLQKYSLDGGVQNGEGHLWSHAGVGYVNTMACGYECAGAQVCVDADDRIWIPEHIVYNVKAVDSAGNLIARFGSYGNADCPSTGSGPRATRPELVDRSASRGDGDPEGANPKPDIPLAWPMAVARCGDHLLIADRVSARIVRARLEYTERREIAVQRNPKSETTNPK